MQPEKPYLTDEEIAELTAPLTQGAARIKFFRRLGVKVEPRPNGQPLVWRAEFEAARIAGQAANDGAGGSKTRNWASFDEKLHARGTKEKRRQSAGA